MTEIKKTYVKPGTRRKPWRLLSEEERKEIALADLSWFGKRHTGQEIRDMLDMYRFHTSPRWLKTLFVLVSCVDVIMPFCVFLAIIILIVEWYLGML